MIHVYCPNCSGEFVNEAGAGGALQVIPTGWQCASRDLVPQADMPLITRIVNESAAALLSSGLPQRLEA